MRLKEIAYARSGDKGGDANIGVIAYSEEGYRILEKIDEEQVRRHFSSLPIKEVNRYPLPNLLAVNFVLIGALGKGGASSLKTDAQGKALGQQLLQMEIS